MKFVLIPAGHFQMGSDDPKEIRHEVTLSHSFYMATTEVTQAQWTGVMGYNNSQLRAAGPNAPVETVSWFEVQEFLRRLDRLGEGHFRLPTEAEWEYACRAGTETPYAFGEHLTTRQANFDGRTTMPVASFPPNAWGLYDMHGNVWEWCGDEVCPYPSGAVTDPVQQCGSRFKPIRGGSWYFGADSARCALRYTHEPQLHGFSIGFRVVRDDAPAKQVPASRPIAWWTRTCGAIEALQVGQGTIPPVLVEPPHPAPVPALDGRRQVIILAAVIDSSGSVCAARVNRGAQGPSAARVDASALEAVKAFRFRPAMSHGKPAAVVYNLSIRVE